jgi:hypothetical protein
MSWLDADFDPDDPSARARMMSALGENDDAIETDAPAAATELPRPATNHSLHSGPPFLRASVPWGAILLREVSPDHSALAAFAEGFEALDVRRELSVHVVWATVADVEARLCVRRAGTEVAVLQGRSSAALHLTFDVGAASGEEFVAELVFGDASRHLHLRAPLRSSIRLDGLLAPPPPPGAPPPRAAALLAPPIGGSAPLLALPPRGLGVELEFLTVAPDPAVSGHFTKRDELAALCQRVEASTHVEWPEMARLRALLRRCAGWHHEVDSHVQPAPEATAARVAAAAGETTADAPSLRLLCGGSGTMKSEFKSPPPTEGALDLTRDGAAEVACLLRLLRHMGAGAPPTSATAASATNLHVHVNVRNPSAGGDLLSCDEVLSVFVAWVRYDAVTARFARPWMWREASTAPLYASGAEFSWHEKAWEQGEGAHPNKYEMYDVPCFLRAVRAARGVPGFAALTDDEKVERLFGRDPGTPASRLGRYCALNLRRLSGYGTLEVRRFHSTLDEAIVMRWVHFCGAFVECFRSDGGAAALLDADDFEGALRRLQAEQEGATADDLMREMEGFVDGRTAAIFMEDAGVL